MGVGAGNGSWENMEGKKIVRSLMVENGHYVYYAGQRYEIWHKDTLWHINKIWGRSPLEKLCIMTSSQIQNGRHSNIGYSQISVKSFEIYAFVRFSGRRIRFCCLF